MARVKPQVRLKQLIDAATSVFIAKGYKRASIEEVARTMGLTPAAIYLFVASKEALFDLVIRYHFFRIDLGAIEEIPIPNPPQGETLARLRQRVSPFRDLNRLTEAMEAETVPDPGQELAEIITEMFNMLVEYRPGVRIIETSALDWPELSDFFIRGFRIKALGYLKEYLGKRIAMGLFRRQPDVSAAARLMLSTVYFFAVNRHFDPISSDDYDEATALQMIIYNLGQAFIEKAAG
jgi:AcrR family transcriptional regulator